MRLRTIGMILACLSLLAGSPARGNPPFECTPIDTSLGLESAAGNPTGNWKGLNVWARDLCGATHIPTNAELIWDTMDAANMTKYLEDVSHGALHVYADDIFADDTSYRYILVDTTLRSYAWLPDSCELDCLWRGTYNPCEGCNDACDTMVAYEDVDPNVWSNRMRLFFRKIMAQVDARVNFAQYDLNGKFGVPDTIVDFVNFYISTTDDGFGGTNAGIGQPYFPAGVQYVTNDTNSSGQRMIVKHGCYYFNIDQNTRNQLQLVTAHEWGHMPLGGWGTFRGISDRYSGIGFPGNGSYDVMSLAGAFEAGLPSPYLPYDVAYTFGWDAIDTVADNQFGTTLIDPLSGTGNVQLVRPHTPLNKQSFLVSFHSLDPVWQERWPTAGVLIWHYSRERGDVASRYWRRIKLEWAGGLYDWDPDSVDALRYAEIDSTSPNTATGLDSMDWKSPWIDQRDSGAADDTLLDRGVGSANQFWGNGYANFDELGNPNPFQYDSTSGPTYSQSKNQHVAIRHIDVGGGFADATLDLLRSAWTGTLASNQTWSGPSVVIFGDITIPNGVTLTIDSGTTVYVMANEDAQHAGDTTRTELIVNGILNAKGTSTKPIVFKSHKTGSDSLAWRGIQVAYNGRATFEHCEFDDMSHGLRIDGADSVKVKHCTFDNVGNIALMVERGDSSGSPNAPKGTTIEDCEFLGGALAGSCGIVIDTGTSVAMTDITVQGIPNAILFRQSSGSLRDVLVTSADTALYANVPSDSTLTCDHLDFTAFAITKGIAARSGTIVIDSSTIYADALTALDAYTGTATIRATKSEFFGSPSTSAAISIGPSARIVISDCAIMDSYIGLESYGNGVDSIIHCLISDNGLYGIKLDTSDAVDYTKYNHIENDTASALNIAYLINRQSVTSVSDTIMGGYNWNFDFYAATVTGLKATVSGLRVKGKPGDDWGLVLNGPSSTGDSAWVTGALVDSVFDGSHLYLSQLYANIADCTFKSIADTLKASPYIIKDNGSTTGKIRCTKALNARTDCVYRASSSSVSYGENTSTSTHGNNSIYVTDTVKLPYTKYFRSVGGSVIAEKNWWGKASPNSSRFAGTVDYTPTLTTGPLCEAGGADKVVAEMPSGEEATVPDVFALGQNYPNPFNPTTRISFQLPIGQRVRIDVFNTLGRLVQSFDLGEIAAGTHDVEWDGRDHAGRQVGSGVYLYRIATPEYIETKKMLLLK